MLDVDAPPITKKSNGDLAALDDKDEFSFVSLKNKADGKETKVAEAEADADKGSSKPNADRKKTDKGKSAAGGKKERSADEDDWDF